MAHRFALRIIPREIVVAMGEVDIILVEDGSPLEWRAFFRCCQWKKVSGANKSLTM